MKAPSVVTFTGIDQWTDLHALLDLRLQYPWVEFGVLYSHTRAGSDPRYPPIAWMERCLRTLKGVALHLCGRAVAQYLAQGNLPDALPFDVQQFSRIQLNGPYPTDGIRLAEVIDLGPSPAVPHITQFEQNIDLEIEVPHHHCLFDGSGGRGVTPDDWTGHVLFLAKTIAKRDVFTGYAGGLSPNNLEQELPRIAEAAGEAPYWIDMESGVRSRDNDHFSIAQATEVCVIVQKFREAHG